MGAGENDGLSGCRIGAESPFNVAVPCAVSTTTRAPTHEQPIRAAAIIRHITHTMPVPIAAGNNHDRSFDTKLAIHRRGEARSTER